MLIERGAPDDEQEDLPPGELRRLPAARETAAARRRGGAWSWPKARSATAKRRRGASAGCPPPTLIRKAREDEQVKALVLRVDSPGGSAFGAELIRRELELTRAAGKPVVVSMGDLAASGGYWVAHRRGRGDCRRGHDHRVDRRVQLLPTAEEALDKLGVHTGGITTTWLGAAYDPRRASTRASPRWCRAVIDHTYADFIAKVAAARKRTPGEIDAVAQGRVWTGAQAQQRGLVDRMGSFGDALGRPRARQAAGRGHADYRITYLEREPGRLQQLLELIGSPVLEVLADQVRASWPNSGLPLQAARELQHELVWLADLSAAAPALCAGGALPVQRPLTQCCAPGAQARAQAAEHRWQHRDWRTKAPMDLAPVLVRMLRTEAHGGQAHAMPPRHLSMQFFARPGQHTCLGRRQARGSRRKPCSTRSPTPAQLPAAVVALPQRIGRVRPHHPGCGSVGRAATGLLVARTGAVLASAAASVAGGDAQLGAARGGPTYDPASQPGPCPQHAPARVLRRRVAAARCPRLGHRRRLRRGLPGHVPRRPAAAEARPLGRGAARRHRRHRLHRPVGRGRGARRRPADPRAAVRLHGGVGADAPGRLLQRGDTPRGRGCRCRAAACWRC